MSGLRGRGTGNQGEVCRPLTSEAQVADACMRRSGVSYHVILVISEDSGQDIGMKIRGTHWHTLVRIAKREKLRAIRDCKSFIYRKMPK